MKSNLIELRISLRLLRFPEKIARELGEFQDWLHSRMATYMDRIPHVVAGGGTLQGNIKTQPGMANVLTAGANRGEMLVFNLH